MQNIAWVTLFRHIPPTFQNGLTVKTRNGTEIAIQIVLRTDHEFVAIKGRLAGTQDVGRLFLIPYAQIDHLGHQKEIKESDFSTMFDGLKMPEAAMAQVSAAPVPGPADAELPTIAQHVLPLPPEPTPPHVDSAISSAVTPTVRTAAAPIKSAVLERFRTRSLTGGSNSGVRPPQG